MGYRATNADCRWAGEIVVATVAFALVLAFGGWRAARADRRVDFGAPLGPSEIVYVVDSGGRVVVDHNGDRSFIPASTIKVFTTLLAARRLGMDHRFTTEFFLEGDTMVVRGRGDPFLVSEELDAVAAALRARLGARSLAGIAVDDSFFAPAIVIPGVGGSANPYDAPNSATAVNFNTIVLDRRGGAIRSTEPQTPLTPLALTLAGERKIDGTLRFNLGHRNGDAARYAAEVIAAKLRAAGVTVGKATGQRAAPSAAPFYVHHNSRTLAAVCRALLEHSNNFVANQVFLAVGAKAEGAPASLEKSAVAARELLAAHPELDGIEVVEGSGLSYDNRATAPAMAALLDLFAPYRDLLKEVDGVRHKTGTLQAARSVVGYLDTARHGTVRFVVSLDGRGSDRRARIVETLRRQL
ncbi:D-alanyl-D-alanine carboxypeptidase [Candidatus Binatia bacterium]|nr:D-alanyl-D-alanine carboxypeptidase [Candidatus Binatia bacterium]